MTPTQTKKLTPREAYDLYAANLLTVTTMRAIQRSLVADDLILGHILHALTKLYDVPLWAIEAAVLRHTGVKTRVRQQYITKRVEMHQMMIADIQRKVYAELSVAAEGVPALHASALAGLQCVKRLRGLPLSDEARADIATMVHYSIAGKTFNDFAQLRGLNYYASNEPVRTVVDGVLSAASMQDVQVRIAGQMRLVGWG